MYDIDLYYFKPTIYIMNIVNFILQIDIYFISNMLLFWVYAFQYPLVNNEKIIINESDGRKLFCLKQ